MLFKYTTLNEIKFSYMWFKNEPSLDNFKHFFFSFIFGLFNTRWIKNVHSELGIRIAGMNFWYYVNKEPFICNYEWTDAEFREYGEVIRPIINHTRYINNNCNYNKYDRYALYLLSSKDIKIILSEIASKLFKAHWVINEDNELGFRFAGMNFWYYKYIDPHFGNYEWRYINDYEFGSEVISKSITNENDDLINMLTILTKKGDFNDE